MGYPAKLIAALMALALAACAQQNQTPAETNVNEPIHTGRSELEGMTTLENKLDLSAGKTYFVQVETLNLRAAASKTGEILGTLGLNDKVKVTAKGASGSEFVAVEVVESANVAAGTKGFVGFKYLHAAAQAPKGGASNATSSLFVIQNIATEKLRVYERRCDASACKNKMVLETEIVVGEAKNDTKTVLGSFKITKWVKFYQDGAGLYPSWYDPSYPPMPERGKGFGAWRDDKALPNGKGAMRGAFGWYTALVGPNSYSQWTHGTIGWGVDKDKYIRLPRKWYVNLFADPRSHGCTRTDNESIAYLRHLLPVGTPIFKVYTHEKIFDGNLSEYSREPKSWQYIMTKNGVRTDGQTADREAVLKAGTPASEYLEEGTYTVKQYPEVRKLSDRYDAGKENIKGAFYIDVGLLEGYEHPRTLQVGGSKEPLPEYLKYKLGAPLAQSKGSDKKDEKKKKKDDEDDDKAEAPLAQL
ncbi:MAG TPA: L,D-transpeptidase family protein [Bdellovibrionales bacterium]|nr:L,D-transpeptidase family protein [Bdellovibrionales bacterium]